MKVLVQDNDIPCTKALKDAYPTRKNFLKNALIYYKKQPPLPCESINFRSFWFILHHKCQNYLPEQKIHNISRFENLRAIPDLFSFFNTLCRAVGGHKLTYEALWQIYWHLFCLWLTETDRNTSLSTKVGVIENFSTSNTGNNDDIQTLVNRVIEALGEENIYSRLKSSMITFSKFLTLFFGEHT